MNTNHLLFIDILQLILQTRGIPFNKVNLENLVIDTERRHSTSRFIFWMCGAVCTPTDFVEYLNEVAQLPQEVPPKDIGDLADEIATALINRGIALANA